MRKSIKILIGIGILMVILAILFYPFPDNSIETMQKYRDRGCTPFTVNQDGHVVTWSCPKGTIIK